MSAKLPTFQDRLTAPKSHTGSDHQQSRFNKDVTDTLLKVADKLDYELQDVALTTGVTRVYHKLGRPWKGWSVWDRDADCRVWRAAVPAGEPSDDSKYIYLQASASVNIRLFII